MKSLLFCMDRTLLSGKMICFAGLLLCAASLPAQPVYTEASYGNNAADVLYDVVENPGGGFTATGYTEANRKKGRDLLLLGFDPELKQTSFTAIDLGGTQECAYAIAPTLDGGYVLAGTGATGTQAMLLKTDEQGRMLWQKNFEGSNDELRDVLQLPNGYLLVTGTRYGRLWYACLSADGQTLLWENTFATERTSHGTALCLTPAGQVLITGYEDNFDPLSAASLLLVKTTPEGKNMFQRKYNNNDIAKGFAVIPLADSSYAIGGTAFTTDYRDDMCLMVTDTAGEIRFVKAYGDKGSDRGFALTQDFDGDLLLAGSTMSHLPNAKRPNLCVRKLNPNDGSNRWPMELCLGGGLSDEAHSLLVSRSGNIVVAGYATQPRRSEQAWLIRVAAGLESIDVAPDHVRPGTVSFTDTNGNDALQAEERGYICFPLMNNTVKTLSGLKACIRTSEGPSGVRPLYETVQLDVLRPAGQIQVTLPLVAAENPTPGPCVFDISIVDHAEHELVRFSYTVPCTSGQ